MKISDTPSMAAGPARGGRRPGAGAPRGNTNAVKTGRYSARLRQALLALRHDPIFLNVYRLLIQAARREKQSANRANPGTKKR